ncbi:hypothetical protein PBY51_022112 [Eleginops maclovinus]|nr:hypothetical protein PBY51_022112 [Eleginops maclovinus]
MPLRQGDFTQRSALTEAPSLTFDEEEGHGETNGVSSGETAAYHDRSPQEPAEGPDFPFKSPSTLEGDGVCRGGER